MQDVLDVAPSGLVPAALKSVKGRRAAARSMMGEAAEHDGGAIQEHENELAEVVIVCEPEGTSLMMGGLHPRLADASLVFTPVGGPCTGGTVHMPCGARLLCPSSMLSCASP